LAKNCNTGEKYLSHRLDPRLGLKENISVRQKLVQKAKTVSLLFFFGLFFGPGLAMRTAKNFPLLGFFISFSHEINTSLLFFS
jgi:hypothetical protein